MEMSVFTALLSKHPTNGRRRLFHRNEELKWCHNSSRQNYEEWRYGETEDTVVLEHGYGELSGVLRFFLRSLLSEIEESLGW